MSIPICPHCQGKRFEAKEMSLSYVRYKLHFVICSSCDTIVGVVNHEDLESLNMFFKYQKKTLANIESRLDKIEKALQAFGKR